MSALMNGSTRRKRRAHIIACYGTRCIWCNRMCATEGDPTADDFLTIEHLMPRSLGGTNRRENLRPACRKCNLKRKNSLGAPYSRRVTNWARISLDEEKTCAPLQTAANLRPSKSSMSTNNQTASAQTGKETARILPVALVGLKLSTRE